jgi:uncharacterized protein (DUF305 family)
MPFNALKVALLLLGGLTTGLAACSAAVDPPIGKPLDKPSTASSPSPQAATASPTGHAGMAGMDHGGHTMDLGPADADYDLRFIDGMTPHHAGALTMAQAVLDQSKRPELRTLAEAIIKAQTAEIASMKQWRQAWYPAASATPVTWHAEMKHMMPMPEAQIKAMRMDVDLGPADDQFDRRFLDAMIPHHEGALDMAKDALGKAKHPEIQQQAQGILQSQAAEIAQMRQWRQAWYKS